MSLRDEMVLTNIMSNEDSSVDVGGNWIEQNACHIAFRFNQDNEEDIEFHMLMASEDLEFLRDWIDYKLKQQPVQH